MRITFTIFCVATFLLSTTTIDANERHALVLGIDQYNELENLKRAVNDAVDVSDALTGLGFTVLLGTNLGRNEMIGHVERFIQRLEAGDQVVIFFAGHGIGLNGDNLLVPSDAPGFSQGAEIQIEGATISQSYIMEQVSRVDADLTILILDACRNNPFFLPGTRSSDDKPDGSQLFNPRPPKGTFVLYSADQGEEALDHLGADDNDRNSVFTRTLLPLLYEQGLDIREIARRTSSRVDELASSVGHNQFPVYRDNIRGGSQFFFTPPRPTPPPHACVDAASMWEAIGNDASIEVLKSFADRHSSCVLASPAAATRIAELSTDIVIETKPPELPAAVVENIPFALASCEALSNHAENDPLLDYAACKGAILSLTNVSPEIRGEALFHLGEFELANGEATVAFSRLFEASRLGNSNAMLLTAEQYFTGDGTPADPRQGIFWLEEAVAESNLDAMVRLASLLKSGEFTGL